jgi:ribonuclease HII
MIDASKKYPEYSFHTHKGYGTKKHYAAIDQYGTSPLHRPSFLVKYYAKKEQLELFSK